MGTDSNLQIDVEPSEFADVVRTAGIDGAGGAGFPAYAKWQRLDEVDYLLVNHQESEPNYYMDKWLGRDHAGDFATFFETLLDGGTFEAIVIAAKEKDREKWMGTLEEATDATVRMPDELPIDPESESGVVAAYTADRYEFGMESVLLRSVADVVIKSDLPMDFGWIVQNTETLYNIYRALDRGTPVTEKFVHVDGNVSRHRFLRAPVGTLATALLEEAGTPLEELGDDQLLADGGPGWCFEIDAPPERFGVRKRSNCLLALDEPVATENRLGNERINVLDEYDWTDAEHETEPTTISPDIVRVPLISNPSLEGIVSPSVPTVEAGDRVSEGQTIADPGTDGFSTPQHASIDGVVGEVDETGIVIERQR